MTREIESPTANELCARGAEIWSGDFDEPETLVQAADGADALFAAGTDWSPLMRPGEPA